MSKTFIHVAEAKKLIAEQTEVLPPVWLSLDDAGGLVLAADVFSNTDVPPFRQSSMDGYALNFKGWQENKVLTIKGTVPAGAKSNTAIDGSTAIRIFTGAPVPSGADTVVMQEKVSVDAEKLTVNDELLLQGQNVREQGSEIRKGELALTDGTVLTAAAVGMLAGVGIMEVKVYPKPTVSIIMTGDELQTPGAKLAYGQVYESNSYALKAALKNIGIEQIKIFFAEDDLNTLKEVLRQALSNSDVVLLTGGVSVGDYDFVTRAAEANGITEIFHKIRQKPGKPIFFGKKGRKTVFGLPGNPASVLTCFYQYVLPYLGQMSNLHTALRSVKVPLLTPYKKPQGLTHFLKGFYDGSAVRQLKAQESFRLSSFAAANCLIELPEETTEIEAGELVEIYLLPS